MKHFLEDAVFTLVLGFTSAAVGLTIYLAIQCVGAKMLWDMIGK